MVYDLEGKAHPDMYTANHKIASKFFGFVVDQEVSYLLGNGVRLAMMPQKRRLAPRLMKILWMLPAMR